MGLWLSQIVGGRAGALGRGKPEAEPLASAEERCGEKNSHKL